MPMLPLLPTDVERGGPLALDPLHLFNLDPIQLEYYAALGVNTSRLSQYSILQRAELANLWYSSPLYDRSRAVRATSEPTPLAFITTATSSGEPTPTNPPASTIISAVRDEEPTVAVSPKHIGGRGGSTTASPFGSDQHVSSASRTSLLRTFATVASPPPLRAVFAHHLPIRDAHETWQHISQSAVLRSLAIELPRLLPVANFTRVRTEFESQHLEGSMLASLSTNQSLWLSRLAACATKLSPAGRANLTYDELLTCILDDATLQQFQRRLEEVHESCGLTAQTIRKGWFSLQECLRAMCGKNLSLIRPELFPQAKRAQSIMTDLAAQWSKRAVANLNDTEVKKMELVSLHSNGKHEECATNLYLLSLCLMAEFMHIVHGARHRDLPVSLLEEATAIAYLVCVMGRPISRAGVLLELEMSHCIDKFVPSSPSIVFLGKHKAAATMGALALGFPAWVTGMMNLYVSIVRPALLKPKELWRSASKTKLFPQEVTGWYTALMIRYAGRAITVSQIRKIFCLIIGALGLSDEKRPLLIAASGHKANLQDTAVNSKFYHSGAKAECEKTVMAWLHDTFYLAASRQYDNILFGALPTCSPARLPGLSSPMPASVLVLEPASAPEPESESEPEPEPEPELEPEPEAEAAAAANPVFSLPQPVFSLPQPRRKKQRLLNDEKLTSSPTTLPACQDEGTASGDEAVDLRLLFSPERVAEAAAAATMFNEESTGDTGVAAVAVPGVRRCRNSARGHKCLSAGSHRQFSADSQPNCDACISGFGAIGNSKRKRPSFAASAQSQHVKIN
jgi:hypothetical protein